jgi:hypothetical protein
MRIADSTGYIQERLVSLIMPVWRPRPDWLLAAVKSALGQRGSTIELVVVDDGCPDPVASLLAGLDDGRLRVIRIEHGGTSSARNAGFAASRGGWIRFVDGDDVLDLDSTAHLLELAGGSRVIAYGATVSCDEELRPASKMVCDLQGSVVHACLLNRFDVTLPSLLFPRAIVERVGEWDSTIAVCQDWDFVLRALEHAPVRGDQRTALFYRRHPGSASAGALGSPESLRLAEEGMRSTISRYFERHPSERGTAIERKALGQIELVMALSHREAYIAYLGRAFAHDPRRTVRELAVFVRIIARKAWGRLPRGLSSRSRAGEVEG